MHFKFLARDTVPPTWTIPTRWDVVADQEVSHSSDEITVNFAPPV
jgi:hypothetical protein